MSTDVLIIRSCLVVCEDSFDQAVFRQALSDVSPNTELHFASNGFDAFYKLATEDLSPDYIFVDLHMRFMDGVDFLQRIKKENEFKDIPVVIHSSLPETDRIEEIRQSGAWAIQFKPYEYFSLCNILNLYFGLGVSGVRQN